ncbi:venom phosphodiesterase-like [Glandiceps talaboti]
MSEAIPQYDKWLDVPCNTYDEAKCPAGYNKRPLVVLAMDGFRAEYLHRNFTPNLQKLATCGVHAPSMRPVFPTYTFPNHYSIVTGLFPESHGIIANNMYDPEFNTVFSLGSSESRKARWWGGEPIWVTAEKQGLRTATYFWPGSDVDIAGIRPTYSFVYDGDTSYEQRTDIVLGWLGMPEEKRPDFITLYFDEPDYEGHGTGTVSDELNEELKRMDGIVGDVMNGITKLGLHHCVDIIVLADHGMAEIGCDKVFFLADYIKYSDYYYRLGPMTRLDPKSSAKIKDPDEVVAALQCKKDDVKSYVKWELPRNWHYANNRRIDDIVIMADEGWTISLRNDSSYDHKYCSGGNHGFDNRYMTMGAIFMAHGPSFKQNLEMDTFLATELYPLMADVLGIEPEPNNATRGSLNYILRNPKPIDEPSKQENREPIKCEFPADYEGRVSMDKSNCTCENLKDITEKTTEDFDRQLELSKSEVNQSLNLHAPLGRPLVKFDASHCVLTQDDYVTGYNNDVKMPMWVSYTVEKQNDRQQLSPPEDCLRPDVRLPLEDSPDCNDYTSALSDNYTRSYLYPPGIGERLEEQMDALISSNLIPQYKHFVKDVWSHLAIKLISWADKYNGINVMTGPVYDYNFDGLRDSVEVLNDKGKLYGNLVIPTHYFVVVTRCQGNATISACSDAMETISFIIPNTDGIQTCQTVNMFLQTHLANIRDIELLTGLYLLPNVPIERSIAVKNFIAVDLWND